MRESSLLMHCVCSSQLWQKWSL